MPLGSDWSKYVAAAAVSTLVLATIAAWWAKSEHKPTQPILVAQEFLQKLEAAEFAQAFELTVQQGYVGRTPEELQELSNRQLCKVERLVSTHPFQSNGNRLRRLVFGEEVDMPQVEVEFSGNCLFGITVRRTKGNEWRVYRFTSHSG